jgi:hypothetical protein
MVSTNCSGALAATAGATVVAVGLLVLIMLAVDVQPASANLQGQSGKIPYSGCDGRDFEIHTINVGGGSKFQPSPLPYSLICLARYVTVGGGKGYCILEQIPRGWSRA